MSKWNGGCRARLFPMPTDEDAADLLVIGAGPAGCATALAARGRGVTRVVMVDRPRLAPVVFGEQATPDVGPLLARLGLDPDLSRRGHSRCYGTLSHWGDGPPIVDHFLRRGWDHGWHLDRGTFDDWLRSETVRRGVRLIRPGALRGLARDTEGWRVWIGGYGEARARVLVDAGGRRAPLATRLGARRHRLDGLVALAVVLERTKGAGLVGLSLVEACPDGWWYAAPLPDGRAVLMLMTDNDIAAARGFRDPENFVREWRQTEAMARLIPARAVAAVATRPAASGFIDHAVGYGWIAVGDALSVLDPLASAGIAGALGDGLAAAKVVVASLGGHCSAEAARAYGHRANAALQRYLEERRRHYVGERRWPESAFWTRRAAPVQPVAATGSR